MEIDSFISEYRKKISDCSDKSLSSDLKVLNDDLNRLQKINELLLRDKYRLVFIGKPGSGKTTTICHYLGLIDDNLEGREFTNIELFNVASGNTTAFEVHYSIGGQTRFYIYPEKQEYQKLMIREYCEYVWELAKSSQNNKEFAKSLKNDEEFSKLSQNDDRSDRSKRSTEINRIIRNMLGVQSNDKFKELIISDYFDLDFESFYQKMLVKIDLPHRTCQEIVYDDSNLSEKEWIKKTFTNINYGKITNVSIPKRVDVFFNPMNIDIDIPDYISEVVDTRGFEENERPDLRKLIHDDDTINILIDKVSDVPNEKLQKILGEWVLKEEKDVIPKIFIFVKVKDNELENVNEADGDAEKGEQIKREEIQQKVHNWKLNYNLENTLFWDSYYGISTENKTITIKTKDGNIKKPKKTYISEYDEEVIISERNRISEHIQSNIDNFKENLKKEAEELKIRVEKLYQDIVVPSLNKQQADFLKKKIISLETLRNGLIGFGNSCGKIKEIFSNYSSKFWHSVKYSTSNKNGIRWNSAKKTTYVAGTWDRAQIYYASYDYSYNLAHNIIQSYKDSLINYLNCEEFLVLKPFFDSCKDKINNISYRELLNSIAQKSHNLLVDIFTDGGDWDHSETDNIMKHRDVDSWSSLKKVETGNGYYGRLIDKFIEIMEQKQLNDKIQDEVIKEVKDFFDNIINLLKNKISNL